ncbi:HlyD family efflux transporter periplasmic adaptor subunit, partial [Oxalobacteraceae bacterium A2-2]
QQDALLEQQNRLQELARAKGALERELGTLKHTLASSDYRGANSETALEGEMQALDQQMAEYQARRSAVVTAPSDGKVTAVLLEPGQRVETAQPLLSILPAGSALTAQLLIPSRAVGFVRREQPVSLRYDAFPYQRFGSYSGRVVQVDRTILTRDLPGMPLRINEPVYRATVLLGSQHVSAYGAPVALQAGMLLSADIAVDRRSLLEWLLDPLYSLRKG